MQDLLLASLLVLASANTQAAPAHTQRIPQFTNDQVAVWETIVYPSSRQILKMHRHDYDRIIVAFDEGKIKIVNNKGQTHTLTLKKNKAYFLQKDKPGELHTDENISAHPVKVMVVELKHEPNDSTSKKPKNHS